jgi:S1-C subfamily serine protease
MKRLLYALPLTLVLLAAPAFAPAAPPDPSPSVKAVAAVVFDPLVGEPYLANICTAASINSRDHYWLTASHCISAEGETTRQLYIQGEPAQLVKRDTSGDLAILRTPSGAPALALSQTGVQTGDDVRMPGFPGGSTYLITLFGKVAAPQIFIAEIPSYHMIISGPVAPGSSGGPILNIAGEIVSVAQRGMGAGASPISAGAPQGSVVAFVEGYLE